MYNSFGVKLCVLCVDVCIGAQTVRVHVFDRKGLSICVLCVSSIHIINNSDIKQEKPDPRL